MESGDGEVRADDKALGELLGGFHGDGGVGFKIGSGGETARQEAVVEFAVSMARGGVEKG